MLATHYPKATELAGVNATQKQLEETLTGIAGETQRKAVAFYLQAAKFSGHPTSKHWKIPPFVARSGTKRPSGSANASNGDDSDDAPPPPPPMDAKARYLDLLLERAKSADGALDEKLLDRIERLIGVNTEDENDG